MQPINIAVIGSNSFSGSSFVRFLLEKGYKVFGFSRSEEPEQVFLPYKFPKVDSNNFEFHKINLNHDLNGLMDVIYKEKLEYIINFSALGMVEQSWLKPEDWFQTNVVAQVKMHDKLRKLDFLKKYVHVTTPEVYGSTEGWISESFNFNPSTPYAVSRASCDLHLQSFFEAYEFPVVFTRAANVYGSGQQLYRIIPQTILKARLGNKVSLHGGGVSERSFIHIDDVSEATLRVALEGKPGDTYHISTNQTLSIKELVEKISKLLDMNYQDFVEETAERLGKDQSYKLNSDKLRNEFGWTDSISLKEGIQETINWVDKNLETLKKLPDKYIHKS